MTIFSSVPCPVCSAPAAATNLETMAINTSSLSCQHVKSPASDIRKELDDWLDDCRFFGSKRCLVCKRYYSADTQTCMNDGTVLREAPAKERPAPLVDNRLQLTSFLGSGSLTEVYGATDLQTNTGVAVKILRRTLALDAKISSAFLEQSVNSRVLSHPNVASVLFCGVLPNGRPYAATEYLPGYCSLMETVSSWKTTDYTHLLQTLITTAIALEYAHNKGIPHFHLSASNIVTCSIQSAMGRDLVKVCDFGLAEKLFRHLGAEQHASRTMGIFGSPLVISPEYSRGEAASTQSDVYGLASLLYSVITKRPTFENDSALGTVLAHLQREPARLPGYLDVPDGLSDLICAGLQKEPEDRPTMPEFRRAMEKILATV